MVGKVWKSREGLDRHFPSDDYRHVLFVERKKAMNRNAASNTIRVALTAAPESVGWRKIDV